MKVPADYEMPDDLLRLHTMSKEYPVILDHMESAAVKIWETATVLQQLFLAKAMYTDENMLFQLDEQIALLLAYIFAMGWFARHEGGVGDVGLDEEVWFGGNDG